MDNNFFNELCKEEAALVDKLRVLREFKAQFFEKETGFDNKVVESKNPEKLSDQVAPLSRSVTKAPIGIKAKVLQALSLIGTGKKGDVANKMMEIFPEYKTNSKKANKDAKDNLYRLLVDGKLIIWEKGNGNVGNTYKVKIS